MYNLITENPEASEAFLVTKLTRNLHVLSAFHNVKSPEANASAGKNASARKSLIFKHFSKFLKD